MSLKIEIFTDGACSGNPGPGGYGIVMKVPEKNYEKRYSQGFRLTTNNRMELLAVITALEKIKSTENDIHIYTDSKYVVDAIQKKWLQSWVKIGFKNKKNPDLWKRMIPLLKDFKTTFHWIKGHAGHLENEICDQLAVKAAQTEPLQIDEFFENQQNGGLF
ncbi:ribonuclease HI [Kaistella jeonii]|uniref:ribonuclease H n=1 Tax=Kaistella jeonii TaxID=266749 RepID=A0A0C1CZV1_9FLAO|nr:ribonuclease HI [Kaistella jeonii]KIA89956.1 ribonuclease HI [Kaistella jeonii]SFB80355.1 ribonuclease HI [Kaistella jeonii]VEI96212.1 Ribonuclease HI [Kaistella jeonii]